MADADIISHQNNPVQLSKERYKQENALWKHGCNNSVLFSYLVLWPMNNTYHKPTAPVHMHARVDYRYFIMITTSHRAAPLHCSVESIPIIHVPITHGHNVCVETQQSSWKGVRKLLFLCLPRSQACTFLDESGWGKRIVMRIIIVDYSGQSVPFWLVWMFFLDNKRTSIG